MTLQPYPPEVEAQMRRFYETLSEKDRRRYAGVEAAKLGRGGTRYISQVLGCGYRTIARGLAELNDEAALGQPGIRRSGGGRKSAFETIAGLDEAFLRVLEKHTAGSPTATDVKWTNLKRGQIVARLAEDEDIHVSVTVVDQLLEKHNYRKRQAFKASAGGQSAQRDEQFQNIARLRKEYAAHGNPILSMDTKKKSCLETFFAPDDYIRKKLYVYTTMTFLRSPQGLPFHTASMMCCATSVT